MCPGKPVAGRGAGGDEDRQGRVLTVERAGPALQAGKGSPRDKVDFLDRYAAVGGRV